MAEEGPRRAAARRARQAPPPRATYRLQFHKDFTFGDAAAIVPYLARLGISHLYASPIQKARPGSTHGYDIVDHAGSTRSSAARTDFAASRDALGRTASGSSSTSCRTTWASAAPTMPGGSSVLEWGELSPVRRAFDIDWERARRRLQARRARSSATATARRWRRASSS